MYRYLLIISLVFLQSCSKDFQGKYYQQFEMPIHPSGQNLQLGYDTYMMAKRVNYDIGESLSHEKRTGFYKSQLQKLSSNENNQSTFYNNTIADTEFITDGNWNNQPAALHKGWVNSEKKTIIKLSIYYSSKTGIHVGILIHPYASPELHYEFQKYLESTGKENEFLNYFPNILAQEIP